MINMNQQLRQDRLILVEVLRRGKDLLGIKSYPKHAWPQKAIRIINILMIIVFSSWVALGVIFSSNEISLDNVPQSSYVPTKSKVVEQDYEIYVNGISLPHVHINNDCSIPNWNGIDRDLMCRN